MEKKFLNAEQAYEKSIANREPLINEYFEKTYNEILKCVENGYTDATYVFYNNNIPLDKTKRENYAFYQVVTYLNKLGYTTEVRISTRKTLYLNINWSNENSND